MIDVLLHRQILLNILKDIYQDNTLAPQLGFKGGTCLYFFYDLSRFSVDLDFNLLVASDHFKAKKMEEILEKYMDVKNALSKKNTWFFLGSYKKSHRNVKVEVSKRDFEDEYEVKDLYGLSVKCMKPAYLFAHKLCAIADRSILANRDIFDAHFMFTKNFPIAHGIIKKCTGLKTEDYFKELIQIIPKNLSHRGILDGLGGLLDAKQKQWVKEHLVNELLFYLRSYK